MVSIPNSKTEAQGVQAGAIQSLWNAARELPLHRQLLRLRWGMPILVLAFATVHRMGLDLIAGEHFVSWYSLVDILVYGVTGSVAAWAGLTWIASAVARREQTEDQLRSAYAELAKNHDKLLLLHDLGRRVSEANDEQSVLELAAQAPLQLTEARASSVITFDEERSRLKLDMAWGLSENYLSALRGRIDTGIPMERCRSCSVLKTHVNSDCPLFTGLQPVAQAEGIGSLICLPIVHEQERVGIIAAYFPSVDGPPEDQVRLLNILGGAIAAMLDSLRVRSKQVGTLHALDQASESMDTLNAFTEQVLSIVMGGWDAQSGGLFLYSPDSQTWTCKARSGLAEDLTNSRYNLAMQLIRKAFARSAPVIVPDLGSGDDYDLLSAAAVPLVSEGEVLGAFFLGAKRRRAISEKHTEFLKTMAHQTALAIRNAQLYNRLGQVAILEERYRLSREIHDGLAQTLGYLNLQAERLGNLITSGRSDAAVIELNEMRQSVRAAYVDVREAIDGLRLSVDDPGLIGARLRDYITEYSRQTGIPVELDLQPEEARIEPATALHLLRIVQEALTNARKHAQARHIQVRIQDLGNELELSVADDGVGFPSVTPAEAKPRSYGLTTMRERAASLGGSMAVVTGPGQGTRIVVNVPLRIGR